MASREIERQAHKVVMGTARTAAGNVKSKMRSQLFGGAVSGVMQRLSIANMVGRQMFGQRDLYATFGYTRVIRYLEAWQRYRRQDMFARVIDAPVSAIWSTPPKVVSTDKEGN